MTGPRTKRQFAGAASDPAQRQITSFFSKASSAVASSDAGSVQSQLGALDGPHLPHQVQTDLLNVGMRVRKAIPEGYKTGSTYSAFTLWDDQNGSTNTGAPGAQATISVANSTYSSTMRELEPFCGLNKVGGLAFQPAHHRHEEAYHHSDNDAMPGLTSSQDTISSTASSTFLPATPSSSQQHQPPLTRLDLITTSNMTTTLPTRKRVLTTDEEDAHNQHHQPHPNSHQKQLYHGPIRLRTDGWLDSEYEGISPRSVAPPAGVWENARVLAVPVPRRSRLQGHKGATAAAAVVGSAAAVLGGVGVGMGMGGGQGWEGKGMEGEGEGEENDEGNVMAVVQGDDFEDASFLDYGGLGGEGRMEIE